MTGKQKCAILRGVRQDIARANGIPYEFPPCTYEGDDCRGTCPRCDAELRYLEQALRSRGLRTDSGQYYEQAMDTYRQMRMHLSMREEQDRLRGEEESDGRERGYVEFAEDDPGQGYVECLIEDDVLGNLSY